jgi:hypothetical protein
MTDKACQLFEGDRQTAEGDGKSGCFLLSTACKDLAYSNAG